MAKHTRETNNNEIDALEGKTVARMSDIAPVRRTNALLDSLIPSFADLDERDQDADGSEAKTETKPEPEDAPEPQQARDEEPEPEPEPEPAVSPDEEATPSLEDALEDKAAPKDDGLPEAEDETDSDAVAGSDVDANSVAAPESDATDKDDTALATDSEPASTADSPSEDTPKDATDSEDEKLPSGLIPIETIEVQVEFDDGPFVPQTLPDDPVTSDGSASRDGVNVSAWRVSTLDSDTLVGISEPEGNDRKARKARRAHARSRQARTSEDRKQRGRARVVVALLLVTAVCCAVALAVTYSMEMWGGKSIPRVVGLSQGNAVAQLEEKGFEVEVVSEPSDTVEGHVFKVRPEMGARVPEGIKVTVTVGESRHIPKVVGMNTEEARTTLEEAGATNLRFVKRNSTKKENVVLEVDPAEDAVFMSSDEIVVYVSQYPQMPDVVGEVEETALSTLKREGIPATRKYQRGDASQRFRVIKTSPKAGEQVKKKVTVVVGDPLIDVKRLSDYLDVDAPHIVDFLKKEGFELTSGHTDDNGDIVATFTNEADDFLSFASDPWSQSAEKDQWGSADAMESNKRVNGVRLSATIARQEKVEIEPEEDKDEESSEEESSDEESSEESNDEQREDEQTSDDEEKDEDKDKDDEKDKDKEKDSSKPTTKLVWKGTSSILSVDATDESGESLATYEQLALRVVDLMGLSDMESSCTQKDIKLPSGKSNKGHEFYCCSGTLGNGVWTVLVRPDKDSEGNQTVEAVVTYAPKASYTSIDLEPFAGRVSDFVAYWDEYQR